MAKVLSKDSLTSIRPIVSSQDTVLYVAEYTNGWKLLAGDKRVVPVVASGQTGSFNQQENNVGASVWLHGMVDQILGMKRSTSKINDAKILNDKNFQFWMDIEHMGERKENRRKTIDIGESEDTEGEELLFLRKRLINCTLCLEHSVQKGPLIQTHWGQNYPWNTNLPQVWSTTYNCYIQPPVGCSAVAMGQLLYYTHYKLNTPTGLFHDVAYTGKIINEQNKNVNMRRTMFVENSDRWDWMPLTNSGYYFNYVADFLADIGYRLGMKYSATGSGAFITKEAMQSFGITYDEKDYNVTDVVNQLDNGMPVLIDAYATETKLPFFQGTRYEDGHQWIISGYEKKIKQYYYTYEWELVSIPFNRENCYSFDEYGYPLPGDNFYETPELFGYEYMTYPQAMLQGMALGQVETVPVAFEEGPYLIMNWGNNGEQDDTRYASYLSAKWNDGGYVYRYLKKIKYNFRKI